ncbi:hypothetical protein SRB5_20890 [Streptomyces sp. RB5]|uniref:Histidine kinase/HSP90-like ATPase domain-containing protein n=1 Tax=Streptomyces smaragdinus TaxID=2585196 RepID=A0A7K0CER6_9ACTN|nr:hypothetical protein [Streptomyces smaragdinus]
METVVGGRARDAEWVRDELREALEGVGVRLPSLGVDVVSYAGAGPLVLIELGRCNMATALVLASVLRSGSCERRGDGVERVERQSFALEAGAVGAARGFLRGVLRAWGVGERVDDMVLCLSELAANAVLHAGGGGDGFGVEVSYGQGCVRIAVSDGCPVVPVDRCPSVDEGSGRGLMLVRALADRQGTSVGFLGKAVWASFDVVVSGADSADRTAAAGGIAR